MDWKHEKRTKQYYVPLKWTFEEKVVVSQDANLYKTVRDIINVEESLTDNVKNKRRARHDHLQSMHDNRGTKRMSQGRQRTARPKDAGN